MSYSISYGPDKARHEKKKRPYFGLVGAVVVIIVCALVIGWSIPQQAEKFALALFPWTRTEARTSFSQLQEDIKDGQPLTDAVTTFCLEIIHNAEKTE